MPRLQSSQGFKWKSPVDLLELSVPGKIPVLHIRSGGQVYLTSYLRTSGRAGRLLKTGEKWRGSVWGNVQGALGSRGIVVDRGDDRKIDSWIGG